MNPGRSRGRAGTVVLALLLTTAAILRSTAIDRGLPDTRHHFSYHPDEYNVIRALAGMEPAKLDFNPHYFHNPTLYYYLCGGIYLSLVSLRLAPALQRDDFHERPIVVAGFYRTGRLLSVAAGLLTIALLFFAGVRRHGLGAGVVSGAVVAFSPAHVVLSQYMDVDALLGLFSAAVVVVTAEAVSRRSWSHVLLAAGLAGLGMATKYNGILLMAPIVIAVWLQSRNRLRLLAWVGLVGLACFLAGAPYTLLDWPGFVAGVRYVLHERVGQRWAGLGHGLLFPLTHTWPWLVGEGHLLALAVALFVNRARRQLVPLLPALSLVAATYMAAAASGTDYVRYSVSALPGIAFLLGEFAGQLELSRRARCLRTTLLTLAVVISSARLLALEGVALRSDPRDDADAFLLRTVPAGSRILVPTEPYFFSPPTLFMDYFYQGRSHAWRRPGQSHGYQVQSANWDARALTDLGDNLLVISEYELTYPAAVGTATADFLTRAIGTQFQEVARFDTPAQLGPIAFETPLPPTGWHYTVAAAAKLRDRRLPHDLKYLNPAVIVYQMRGSR